MSEIITDAASAVGAKLGMIAPTKPIEEIVSDWERKPWAKPTATTNHPTIEEVLANRGNYHLRFSKPWVGMKSDGKWAPAHVVTLISVDVAINVMRHESRIRTGVILKNDQDLLRGFISMYGAEVREGCI